MLSSVAPNLGDVVPFEDLPKGHKIIRYPIRNFNDAVIQKLVEESFNQRVVDNYIDQLLSCDALVYYETADKGLAIVIPAPGYGIPPHLKTFAVSPNEQEKGVGSDLLTAVRYDFKQFNLRSRKDRISPNEKYEHWIGKPKEFVSIDGITYNGYFENHSRLEKQLALEYMAKRPSACRRQ
ncbi:hypothetical protein HYW20_03015 [Candidatus Woesearchaeota archaeon]|nr:hypothetical protein [Candidatus Woesearchaeota archaeon]